MVLVLHRIWCTVLYVLILGMLWPRLCLAEDVARTWTAFRQHDGLAHNVVNAVVQSPDGAMWFGTFGGVSRYDGHSWQNFGAEAGLSGNEILDLFATQEGVIWAAVGGGFTETKQAVARFSNGQWKSFDTSDALFGRFGARRIMGLGSPYAGVITDDGRLLLYDGKNLTPVLRAEGEPLRGVQGMMQSADGTLWVFYGSGRRSIFRFGAEQGVPVRRGDVGVGTVDIQTGMWRPFAQDQGLGGESVLAMAQTPDGALWFGTANGGLRRFYEGKWQTFTTANGLPSDRVQVIAPTAEGSVWVGTPAGVALGHPLGRWVVYSEKDGLPNNFIESICVAKDGAVWVGTRGGVARFGSVGWVHHAQWPGRDDRGGIALARGRDGVVWATTAEGVYRLDETVWYLAHRLASGRGRVLGLGVDGQGRLWGGVSGQLFFFEANQWHDVALPETVTGPLRAFSPAHSKGVYVAARSGVFRFDGQVWISLDVADWVSVVFESADGGVWIGRNDEVLHIVNGERHLFGVADGVPEGQITEIAQDKQGRIWVSSLFEGVAFYDPAQGQKWTRVPRESDAQMNGVRRIYSADDGTMWLLSTIDGAIHTDGAVWVRYTVREGLPSSQVWDACQDVLGQLWFATTEGLACYVPDREPPETRLLSPPEQIAPYQSVLIEFTGQDAWKLSPEWTLQYAWRLDGGVWSPYSRSTRVLLPEPPAGHHMFEVRAMDLAFNVDASPEVHVFEVLAPVWQRPWFVLLCLGAVLALGLSSGYALQRNRRWRNAQAQLIHELESELREAHEMQMRLLPRRTIVQGGFEVAGRCLPANHVGGDYYTYFWLDDHKQMLGFGAADVSGKAMQAAVRAMQLSGIFRYEFRTVRPPCDILGNLHAVLLEQFDRASFVTCCLGMLNFETGHIHLGNAAHPYPYHYSSATNTLRVLELSSVPLGMIVPVGTNVTPAEAEILLQPGDALILYSDGVTDMQNDAGDFYEEARLEGLIKAHIASGADALIDAVCQDLAHFRGAVPQTDDVTLLVLARRA